MAIDNLVDNRPQLAIDLIRTDGGTQPRAELNQAHLDELVELLNDGRTFKDPVVVFYDGSNYWLADGFHRLNATKIAGLRYVDIDVRSGTHENAVEFSCGANATHGLRRTNDDKQRAVRRLLDIPKWQNESNVKIARQCGVTEHLVRIVRSELPEEHPASTKSRKATNLPVEPVEEVEKPRLAEVWEDKRNTVRDFLSKPESEGLSNVAIAQKCGVDEKLVRKIRKELQDEQERAEQEAAKAAEPEPVVEPTPEPTKATIDTVTAMDTPATLDDTEDDEDHDYGDEEDEEEYIPYLRYDGTYPAHCKYCYETHFDWMIDEGDLWICGKCNHATNDEFMQIDKNYVEDTATPEPELQDDILLAFSSDVPVPIETQAQTMLDMAKAMREQAPAPAVVPFTDDVDEEEDRIPEVLSVKPEAKAFREVKAVRVEPSEEKEQRDAHVMRVMGSSDSPEWYTPHMVIDRVLEMFSSIDTDPCSNSHENPNVPARVLYTKEDDGLAHTWQGKTYLNPPYGSEIGKWTNKLIADYQQGHVEEALALLPARIDTIWFHPLYDFPMCNVRGRIQFANSPYGAPFPCVIVYLGKREDVFIETFKTLGPIMRRIG